MTHFHALAVADCQRDLWPALRLTGLLWDKTALPAHDRACRVSDKPASILLDGLAAFRLLGGQSPARRDG